MHREASEGGQKSEEAWDRLLGKGLDGISRPQSPKEGGEDPERNVAVGNVGLKKEGGSIRFLEGENQKEDLKF